MAVEANYGGRQCSGNKMELTTCLHEDMGKKEKSKDAIYYCPGEELTLFLTRQSATRKVNFTGYYFLS